MCKLPIYLLLLIKPLLEQIRPATLLAAPLYCFGSFISCYFLPKAFHQGPHNRRLRFGIRPFAGKLLVWIVVPFLNAPVYFPIPIGISTSSVLPFTQVAILNQTPSIWVLQGNNFDDGVTNFVAPICFLTTTTTTTTGEDRKSDRLFFLYFFSVWMDFL